MTVTQAGPAHAAGAHAVPPAVQMVQMLAGFQVSQALYAAAAAAAGARLVAFELVVPDGDGPHMAKMIDLTMLGMLNGRERTRAEYRLLLEQAGFEFEAVTATPAPVSVITARA
jgi:hypothetical protein